MGLNWKRPGEGIYQVNPGMSREEMASMRQECAMEPATFNYSDPTPEMQHDPLWNAIWDEIKTWDINVPTEYAGYCGATGNHVTAIYKAIQDKQKLSLERIARELCTKEELQKLIDSM